MTTVGSTGDTAEATALVRGSRKRRAEGRGGRGRREERGMPRQPRMDRASSSEIPTHGRPRPELDGDGYIWDLDSVRSSQGYFDPSPDPLPNPYLRIDGPSHQKARAAGYVECWTVVNVDRFDEEMAQRESPSTDRFYRISDLSKREGAPYFDFRNRIISLAGIEDESDGTQPEN